MLFKQEHGKEDRINKTINFNYSVFHWSIFYWLFSCTSLPFFPLSPLLLLFFSSVVYISRVTFSLLYTDDALHPLDLKTLFSDRQLLSGKSSLIYVYSSHFVFFFFKYLDVLVPSIYFQYYGCNIFSSSFYSSYIMKTFSVSIFTYIISKTTLFLLLICFLFFFLGSSMLSQIIQLVHIPLSLQCLYSSLLHAK